MRATRRAAGLHVGLNLVFLVPGETGGLEVYARELSRALLEVAPPHVRFTAFVNRETASEQAWPEAERMRVKAVPVRARNRVEWVLGEQLPLPAQGARARIELMHSLATTAPVWGPFRRVVTIHDLIYARYPQTHAGVRGVGMRLLVPAAARRSDRVIVGSQATRRDLVELLHLDPSAIDVVPYGLGAVRRASPLPESQIRSLLDLDERRVLLSLSAKRPHKNLLALIGALALVPAEDRPVLVLPGYPTWHEAELRARAAALGVADDLRLPGWLPEAELEALWQVSEAFVFPSLYEGFGMPVLEAMARGVPVACSNASSLPEVAGEAALLFDPEDERAIAAAIGRLGVEPELRAALAAAGRERAARFTWERAAQLTLESYARALGRPPA